MQHLDRKSAREMTPEALSVVGAPEMVYVRETTIEDLQQELPKELSDKDLAMLAPGTKLYAIHAANGAYMAIVDSRAAALNVALENEYTPVSVH